MLPLEAQRDLKILEDEASSILGSLSGSENKIEKATLTREDERSVTVSLRFSGFGDKEYQMQVAILNSRKEVMDAVSIVQMDLPKSKQSDITLLMTDPQKTMSQSSLVSKYIRVRVAPKSSGIGDLLTEAFDDLNLSGSEFLIELDKKWMLMGANVKMTAKLTPFKNAGSIPSN
jgi:hypothetical protein